MTEGSVVVEPSKENGVIFGKHDDNTLDQFADIQARAVRAALMADGHLGYVMPIGGVAAYRDEVSVMGVGFDIGCGNAAILTDLWWGDVQKDAKRIADEISKQISFGIGRSNASSDAPADLPMFNSELWEAIPSGSRTSMKARARSQLGTVGSGNHYVDVFADEHDRVWVGVHFGSRGLGHAIASGFLAMGLGSEWGERVAERECLLDLGAEIGKGYWAAMTLAGEYAYAGREWVARKVVTILGGLETELIHNHHNFAWKERHFGEEFVVIRKGATPAFGGQMGFVGGSMGDDAVIVEGAREPEPDVLEVMRHAMFSTVHGAGRVMSRRAAAGKVKKRRLWSCGTRACEATLPPSVHRNSDGSNPKCPECGSKMFRREIDEVIRAGAVSREMMDEWIEDKGVIVRGGGLDESPHVYRRLPDVLEAQGDTITVLHRLRPKIVVMAGADEFDPYKD